MTARGSADLVRVLSRGLAILQTFTPKNDWRSNHEIATATGLPRPTVSRLTANLTALGYLVYSPEMGKYRLGTGVLALGFASIANLDVRLIARPLMQELADGEDLLVVLASRDGLAMVCNEVCHSSQSILTLRVSVGSRLFLPYSAMGRALVGALPEEARNALLKEIAVRHRSRWDALEPALADACAQIKRQGFVVTMGTLEEGVSGAAVVVSEPGAPFAYTLGVAGPAFRFPRERLRRDIGPRLLAIKARIESQLASGAIAPATQGAMA